MLFLGCGLSVPVAIEEVDQSSPGGLPPFEELVDDMADVLRDMLKLTRKGERERQRERDREREIMCRNQRESPKLKWTPVEVR